MKRFACLFFAQLLAVMSVSPLVRAKSAAAPPPPSGAKAFSIFTVLRKEDFRCVLKVVEEQLAAREGEQRLADAPSVAGPDAGDFRMSGGARLFSIYHAAAEDDFVPDEEACKRIAKEFVSDLKETEEAMAPISSSINEQMGSSGSRLDVPKFMTTFPSILKRTEEDMAKRGIDLTPIMGAGGGSAGMSPGAALGILLTIIGTANLYEILERWDKQMEQQWAQDLLACGIANDPDQAFEMAEAMGDIRMHWLDQWDFPLHMPIAKWYHGRETVEDGRLCLAENHQRRKDIRQRSTRPGSDYHQPSRPGRPNANHGDPRTSGACRRYEYMKIVTTGEQGEIVDEGVTLVCVEYW